MLTDVLRHTTFFATLPDETLAELAAAIGPSDLPADTVLFHEGDPGNGFYILLEGQVKILKAQPDEGEHVIALRGPGDHIGEMSLLEPNGKRTATARTCSPVRAVHITRAQFEDLLYRYPALGYQMARVMSDRLNQAHSRSLRELEEQNRQLRDALMQLRVAQAELLEKKQLERELEVARKIQLSMLPVALPELPSYQFGAVLQPMSLVGGDFYDLMQLPDGNVGIAIGDVSGHGVPAALIMAVTVALLRTQACSGAPPGEVLRRVNTELLRLNTRQMFVTVLYGVLEARSGRFIYCRAGHEMPLLVHADGTGVYLNEGYGRLLGLFNDVKLEDATCRLDPGDLLLLYTDGVIEARNAAGDFFDEERLLRETLQATGAGPQALCEQLLGSVGKHSGPQAQDDITLVAMARPQAAA